MLKDFEENDSLKIEEIIKHYNSYIYTIIRNSITNQEDVEEILSDVFTILWKNYENLDKNLKVRPYIVGITRNLIKKKYRTLKIDNNIEDYEDKVSDYIDVQYLVEKNEKSKVIQEELDKMKLEEQKIFIMFYYNSRKVKEISKELNISESKVKITLYRLRKSIQKKLKERGYGYGK